MHFVRRAGAGRANLLDPLTKLCSTTICPIRFGVSVTFVFELHGPDGRTLPDKSRTAAKKFSDPGGRLP
jgi:hypothetical protein